VALLCICRASALPLYPIHWQNVAIGTFLSKSAISLDTAAAPGRSRIPTHNEWSNTMTVNIGLLALLEAKPGKGDDLAAFLEGGRALAVAEEGTVTWYAFKIDDTNYGIFDTFETEEARQAHLNGEIPKALGQVAPDLLAADPNIRLIDVISVK
jgi:quinol monooxygenase YgiN